MSDLSINIKGLNGFLHDVQRAGVQAEPLIRAALQNSATKVQRNVRERAPHRTGQLQRSVLTQIEYPSATVSVNEKYGVFIEDGTKPHIIAPTSKKALFWKGAPNPYRLVHHPGTKAKPFFKPGVDATTNYINDQFMKVVEKLIHVMAGHA